MYGNHWWENQGQVRGREARCLRQMLTVRCRFTNWDTEVWCGWLGLGTIVILKGRRNLFQFSYGEYLAVDTSLMQFGRWVIKQHRNLISFDDVQGCFASDESSLATSIQLFRWSENLENKGRYEGQPADRTASRTCCVLHFHRQNKSQVTVLRSPPKGVIRFVCSAYGQPHPLAPLRLRVLVRLFMCTFIYWDPTPLTNFKTRGKYYHVLR